MSVTEPLERSMANFKAVLANVSKDDLDKQSPCAAWKVRDIVNHVTNGSDFFVTGLGGPAFGDNDFTSGDFHAAFDDACARTLAAFNEPGAMEKTANMPFGPIPAPALMGIATTDIFTHAWDLAKATGQSTDIDPEFAGQIYENVQATIPDAFRGEEGSGMPFCAKQEAPAGACNADKVAAFLGRRV
ncbi:MAG TPA: TIGR03086 family metal-binding protein [Acidimicrobiales bacterium]|nr:TIGR03086 family metal-binding protein [Acidimicrobiales bacterium]